MERVKIEQKGFVDKAYDRLSIKGKDKSDYQVFDFSESQKLSDAETPNLDADKFKTTKRYDDNSFIVREYKKEEGYDENHRYSVIATYTDKDGNISKFSGTQEFDDNGELLKSNVSGKTKDGSTLDIFSSNNQQYFNVTVTDKNGSSESASYNDKGDITEYSSKTENGSSCISIDFDDKYSDNIHVYSKYENGVRSEFLRHDGDVTTVGFEDNNNIETLYKTDKSDDYESETVTIKDKNSDVKLQEKEVFNNYAGDNIVKVTDFDSEGNVSAETLYTDYDKDGIADIMVKDIFDENGEIKKSESQFYTEGVMGERTMQGYSNNCQLYAGLNALSYGEKGKDIIKKSITMNDDGSYNVYFKGLDETYTVTQKDLRKSYRNNPYNKDVTMTVLITAYEKALENIEKNKKDYSLKERSFVGHIKGESITSVNDLNQTSYMLAGVDSTICLNRLSIGNALKTMKNNPDDIVATAVFIHIGEKGYRCITDVNGEEYAVSRGALGFHEIAIKKVDDKTVTIVNPWNGAKDIVVDKNEFMKQVNFIEYFNLNEKQAGKFSAKCKRALSQIPYWAAKIVRRITSAPF